MAQNLPVSLSGYYFTRVEIAANPLFSAEKRNGPLSEGPESSLKMEALDEDSTRFVAALKVTAGQKESSVIQPYIMNVECVGELSIDPAVVTDEATRAHIVMRTAHQVLYGAAREMIASVTARQPFGQAVIPLALLALSENPSAKLTPDSGRPPKKKVGAKKAARATK